MGIWFEVLTENGAYFLVAHINIIWLVIIFILIFLWGVLMGRGRRGGGRY